MIDDYIPWYIGWANCDEKAGDILRQHYQIPFFIPEDSAPGKKDWIFMGTPGFGAPFHLDNVNYPSWQAQVPIGPISFKSQIDLINEAKSLIGLISHYKLIWVAGCVIREMLRYL